jgi:hypothetical protein
MSLPPSYNLLEKFPNMNYIETGCWHGDSMDRAYFSRAFDLMCGIESDKEMYDFCVCRFDGRKNVRFILGDSAVSMHEALNTIVYPATIFLDAHDSLIEGEKKHPNRFPLFQELHAISLHHVKQHTIIVDDILHLTHPDVTGWNKKMIEDALLKINPKYKLEYIANPIINNMLIATV